MRTAFLLAIALISLPALTIGLIDYAAFRADNAQRTAAHDAHMSTVNGVHVGRGEVRMRITAEHPDLDGPELWLDRIASRKTCATLTLVAYRDGPERYLEVACLNPETDTPVPGLSRAAIWPDETAGTQPLRTAMALTR